MIAALIVVLAWLLSDRRVPPLPGASGEGHEAWRGLASKASARVSAHDVEAFRRSGRLLVQGVLPAVTVEELLLPDLASISTPWWASWFLPHVGGRFSAVRYGVSLYSRAARDFWSFGPASEFASRLLGSNGSQESVVLLADVYYVVAGASSGLPFHTDSATSFCLAPPEVAGLSFWLALDDVFPESGGGLEVCDAPLHSVPNGQLSPSCETYTLRRGDAIIFSRHAPHRTVPWQESGVPRIRRALVGRLVPAYTRLHQRTTPPALVATNGFDGPYLCRHGLSVGALLNHSACFVPLGVGAAEVVAELVEKRIMSPLIPLLQHWFATSSLPTPRLHLTQSVALSMTLAVELLVTHMWWRWRKWTGRRVPDLAQLLAACAACSLITHPCVWFWASVVFASASRLLREGVVEVLITLVEGFILHVVMRRDWDVGVLGSLTLSAAMNVSSVVFGFALCSVVDVVGGVFSLSTSLVSWCLGVMLLIRLEGVL